MGLAPSLVLPAGAGQLCAAIPIFVLALVLALEIDPRSIVVPSASIAITSTSAASLSTKDDCRTKPIRTLKGIFLQI
jgi:hypothetical protein